MSQTRRSRRRGTRKRGKRMQTRKCKVCGCTNADCRQCILKTGRPCHWITPNLCSACTTP